MKCNRTISFKEYEGCGADSYHQCNRLSKYKVSYKGIRGEITEENVCGIHLAQIKKMEARLKDKAKYDIELTITNI